MTMPLLKLATATVACLGMSCAAPAFAQAVAPTDLSTPAPTIAITGGRLLTITHGVIENGTIILSGGKIAAVGAAGSVKIPAGATIVDAKGMTVYPGLIDSETNLGLSEIEADDASNDLVEMSDEIFPNMHVYDAFHAETERIPVDSDSMGSRMQSSRRRRATRFPAKTSFIQLAGRDRDQMILPGKDGSKDVALAMNFSGDQRRRGQGSQISVNAHGAGVAASSNLHGRPGVCLELRPSIRPSSTSGRRVIRKSSAPEPTQDGHEARGAAALSARRTSRSCLPPSKATRSRSRCRSRKSFTSRWCSIT